MWYQSDRSSDRGGDGAASGWERSRMECFKSVQTLLDEIRVEMREWRSENQEMHKRLLLNPPIISNDKRADLPLEKSRNALAKDGHFFQPEDKKPALSKDSADLASTGDESAVLVSTVDECTDLASTVDESVILASTVPHNGNIFPNFIFCEHINGCAAMCVCCNASVGDGMQGGCLNLGRLCDLSFNGFSFSYVWNSSGVVVLRDSWGCFVRKSFTNDVVLSLALEYRIKEISGYKGGIFYVESFENLLNHFVGNQNCNRVWTDGLTVVTASCKYLRKLDLQKNEVEEHNDQWVNCLRESCTTLVSSYNDVFTYWDPGGPCVLIASRRCLVRATNFLRSVLGVIKFSSIAVVHLCSSHKICIFKGQRFHLFTNSGEMEQSLVKEMFKNFGHEECGWTYVVFWKLRCDNSTLFVWEDGHCRFCFSDMFQTTVFHNDIDIEILMFGLMFDQVHVLSTGIGGCAAYFGAYEWQKQMETVRSQHASDLAALLTANQELQRVQQEISMVTEAKNTALGHADDAMKIAEMNAEKVEHLSSELVRLKSLLDMKLEAESHESSEMVKKLNSEIDYLNQELERSKESIEIKAAKLEGLIENLKTELKETKIAHSDKSASGIEWQEKATLLETQLGEVTLSEKSTMESLAAALTQHEGNNALLLEAKTEANTLKEEVKSLETSIAKYKLDLEESCRLCEATKLEAGESTKTIESLKLKLENIDEEKEQALENMTLSASKVQNSLEEKNELLQNLEELKVEKEKHEAAGESLASSLLEMSKKAREAKEKLATVQAELEDAGSQMEDLKLSMKTFVRGVVVIEVGFGVERFMNIKYRYSGLKPQCAVIVATSKEFLHEAVKKPDSLFPKGVIPLILRKPFNLVDPGGVKFLQFTAIVTIYVKCGNVDTMCCIFGVMIVGYELNSIFSEAIGLLRRMCGEDIPNQNKVAVLSSFVACDSMGSIRLGKMVHKYVMMIGKDMYCSVAMSSFDMYAKSGGIGTTCMVFEKMCVGSLIKWSAMIRAQGLERNQVLKRWLVALSEVESFYGSNANGNITELQKCEDGKRS